MVGTQIGTYRIERTLGKGGFGVVYVGVDLRLGRRAAIKQLLPELSGNREIVERFFNEAKAAANINHPGIVEIYEVGWHTDGSAYFAMKLLNGDDLRKRLRQTGPLSARFAATIARQVSSALAAAHACGIVHRDLKPDNIVLVPDDEVSIGERATVLDFGIAKLLGERPASQKTRSGMMLGTPVYMSPEQCRGAGKVDHRSDVYSLGCILFEMLTGRPPFEGEGEGEILGKHQFVTAPALRSLRPDAPPELEALVMRTLAKQPDERFQQMSELTAALQPFAAGGRSMERPAAYAPPQPPSSQRAAPTPRTPAGTATGDAPQQPDDPPSDTLVAVRDKRFLSELTTVGRRGITIGAALVVVLGVGIAVMRSSGTPAEQAAATTDAEIAASLDSAMAARTDVDAAVISTAVQDAGTVVQQPSNEPSNEPSNDGEQSTAPADQTAGSSSSSSSSHGNEDRDKVANVSKNEPKRVPKPKPLSRPSPSPPPPPPPASPSAASDHDPVALLMEGKLAEKNGDWQAALIAYQKLEKIKGHTGHALYLQARVALTMNNTDTAIRLAVQSAMHPGLHKTDAKFLYADALYRQGEYRRAKDVYIGLRRTLVGEMQAVATRKIAAINRALKLPENDGISDPP